MPLRRLLLVVLVVGIASLLVFGAASGHRTGQTRDLTALSNADLKAVVVHLERTACYGSCPIYSVSIHGDGRVEYEGKGHVKLKGKQEGKIELAAVKTLMSEFARAKFLSLPGDYSEEHCKCGYCTDRAGAVTELRAGGVLRRVNHYHGCACAPKALFELESAIDKAANTEQWTGDVSHAGPRASTCFAGKPRD